MRKTWALLLIVVFVGAVVLVVSDFTEPKKGSASTNIGIDSGTSDSASNQGGSQESLAESDTAFSDLKRTANDNALKAAGTNQPTVLITVTNGESGERIPGAKVVVAHLRKLGIPYSKYRQSIDYGCGSDYDFARVTYFADQNGQVRIPLHGHVVRLTGSTPTLFNDEPFDATDHDKMNLLLWPDKSIAVHVVDQQANPVEGIRVSLRQVDTQYDYWVPSSITDADGMAFIRITEEKISISADEDFAIVLDVLASPAVAIPIELDNLPTQPVQIVKPATGQLEFLLVDENGSPSQGLFQVTLRSRGKNSTTSGGHDPQEASFFDHTLQELNSNGIVRFPFVDLNLKVRANIDIPQHRNPESSEILGPTVDGQTITITKDISANYFQVSGRLLNEQGEVEAFLELDTELYSPRGTSLGSSNLFAATDGEGRFKVSLRGTKFGSRYGALALVLQGAVRKPRRLVEIDLSDFDGPGTFDVGDLVLSPEPVVVSGQVVDSSGSPVTGVTLHLEEASYSVDAPEGKYWKKVTGIGGRTDDQGKFSLRSRFDQGEFRIVTRHGNLKAPPCEFRRNQTDVIIRMRKKITVTVGVFLDDHISYDDLEVQIEYADDSTESGFSSQKSHGISRGPVEDYVRYRVPNIYEGIGTLRISTKYLDVEVYSLDGLTLQAEKYFCHLEDIDLRGQLTSASISIVDEEGKPLDSSWIKMASVDFPLRVGAEARDLIVPHQGLDFEAGAIGYRAKFMSNVTGVCQVVLTKGLPIRVQSEYGDLLPEGWSAFAVFYTGDKSLTSVALGMQSNLVSKDEIAFVPSPGQYKVEIYIQNEQGFPLNIDFGPAGDPEIQVADAEALQTFTLATDSDALQAAVAIVREWSN